MTNFKDIQFKKKELGGIRGSIIINDITLSVVGDRGAYSEPRQDLDSEDQYDTFEVALVKDGSFVTRKVFPDEMDDVIGWQTRDDINRIILEIPRS